MTIGKQTSRHLNVSSSDSAALIHIGQLALDCVHREYPNKIAHVLSSDADAAPPRRLTPAFYGCFDWHSAVHGHWLLARVARMSPDSPFAQEARAALRSNITSGNIAVEAAYLDRPDRAGFERPYGLAWLLALGAELRLIDTGLATTIQPLEAIAVRHLSTWLEKLPRPDRSGQHPNTAFAMGLMLDWARSTRNPAFEALLIRRARAFYANDRNAPLAWEPAGEDFLSPCLSEADLMRRVLPNQADDREPFARWFDPFLPSLDTLSPVTSPDRSDGKLAHLDGLNLSRAWMLQAIALALPEQHPRRDALLLLSDAHASAGLASVTGQHYEGGHWLGTFAAYLLTAKH